MQHLAELASPLLVDPGAEQPDDLAADRAGQRVAAERAAVLTRAQHAEHVAAADHGADRHDPAAERLAEHHQVGLRALVLPGERLAGAPEAGLDLVQHEQHVALGAQHPRGGQVAGRRHEHPGLALDRLEQHGDRGLVDRGGQRVDVAVRARSGSPACRGRSRPAPAGSVEKLTIVVVRPWKLPSATTIVAWPSGTPLTW